MKWQWFSLVLLVAMAVATTVLYVLAPPAGPAFMRPDTAKILFLHVPEAMQSSLFFLYSAICGAAYLKTLDPKWDHRSRAALEVGFIFSVLATLTGMVFAQQQWGAAWNWDPRQKYILNLLLIYAAYFALRTGFFSYERTAAYASAYAIFSFLTVPFLVWVLPRMQPSQHGQANRTILQWQLDTDYGRVFILSSITILLIGVWCYNLRRQELFLVHKKEADNERSVGAGDSTDSGVVRPVRIRHPKPHSGSEDA